MFERFVQMNAKALRNIRCGAWPSAEERHDVRIAGFEDGRDVRTVVFTVADDVDLSREDAFQGE
jgi:hypothetical protein